MRDTIETAFIICGMHQKISGTSGKNHFHEMNGDVDGRMEVKYEKYLEQEQLQLLARKSYIHPYIFLLF